MKSQKQYIENYANTHCHKNWSQCHNPVEPAKLQIQILPYEIWQSVILLSDLCNHHPE